MSVVDITKQVKFTQFGLNKVFQGHIDKAQIQGGTLNILGWAGNAQGGTPAGYVVRVNGANTVVKAWRPTKRSDVQKHLGCNHDKLGFELTIDLPGGHMPSTLNAVQVYALTGYSE